MKTNTISIPTIFGFLGLLLFIHTFSAHAAIECSTAFGEKSFTIEDSKISFQKEDESGASRAISSVNEASVRTHKKHLGFEKTLYLEGNRHRIRIQDVNSFSDANDYLSITSPKGHEMTYPLTCHSV